MTHFLRRICSTSLSILVFVTTCYGSVDSISEIGINSINIPYTGEGISVGQVDLTRPGTPDIDDGSNSNFFTTPEEVYLVDDRVEPTPNAMDEIFRGNPPVPHATWVAGVVISKDPFAPGAAPDADLYASHGSFPTNPFLADSLELTSQFIATRDNDDVRAINMAFLVPFDVNEIAKWQFETDTIY
jgi:hypothetical protein